MSTEEIVKMIEDCLASMERDINECDKMFLHISRAKFLVHRLQERTQQNECEQERDQGCKYCTRGKDIQMKFEGEEAGRAWIHNCSDGYGLFLEGEVITYIDVRYCPMCGKKLQREDTE